MKQYEIHHGDCLEVLKAMPDNSIDSVVCDPPYGLSDHKPADVVACMTAWLAGEPYLTNKRGFMGKTWDSWVPGPEVWRECLRVLKPGGHVLAFAGSRTHDLMSMAMRLAGFECRDTIMYLYGSGFPKSLDVSKAIDKAGGGTNDHIEARRRLAQEIRSKRERAGISRAELASWFPEYSTVTANWERVDAGFRVPTEVAYSELVERLGIRDDWRDMVRAEDLRRIVAANGVDRRDDGTVYGLAHSGVEYAATTDAARQWSGWGTSLKPAFEPVLMFRKPIIGTVAENVLAHGTGALNIDGCRIGHASDEDLATSLAKNPGRADTVTSDVYGAGRPQQSVNTAGRWPANLIHDGSEPADMLGDAARFFYCAKASKRDRDEGLEGFEVQRTGGMQATADGSMLTGSGNERATTRANIHPTVKPTDLMAYLVRLVTPPGGTVLDPFMGSGSTGKAAMHEGFRFIGIERESAYLQIAQARIEHALLSHLGII